MTARILTKAAATVTVLFTLLLAFAPAASAHDPIFLAEDQRTPDTGPYMPDGSISWALYGSVLAAEDTRGFEFDLRDGDELYISLLIPNREPEVSLADQELPVLELESPDGEVRTIVPEVREVFDEPFSNTSYVTLAEVREPGLAGRYRGVVVGSAPSRFTVAIGETEIFFTETERSGDRPSTFLEISEPLLAWYATPPGGEPDADLADGEGEIQLDLVEEAMESGEGQAPEGALDGAGEDEVSESPEDEVAEAEDDVAEAESPEAAEDEVAEADPADGQEESDAAEETASAPVSSDDGGSTWVAPAVIASVVLVGGGVYFSRRRDNSPVAGD